MPFDLWEKLDNLNFNEYECVKKGFMRNEKGKISIYRDDKSKLLLKVEGEANEIDFHYKDAVGWINRGDKSIEFKHKYSDIKIIIYACPISRSIKQSQEKNTYIDIFVVDEFELINNDELIGAEYLLEFVDNLKINYIFSNTMSCNNLHKKEYKINGLNFELIKNIVNENSLKRNLISIKLEEDEIFILKHEDSSRGVIIYKRNVEIEKREKIRKILSFVLGCPLILYGYSFVNKYLTPKLYYAKNINDSENKFLNINFELITNINKNYSNLIDSNYVQNLVKNFFDKYDEYNFNNVFYTYWIAVSSNSITAAVHYGAIVENLQKRYMELNNAKYSKILEKKKFRELKENLFEALNKVDLTEVDKNIFKKKIENMNNYSQKDIMDFFCKDISLTFSDDEKNAWQQRNDAAHGNEVNNVEQAWKNTMILRELVNKLILRLLTSNRNYFSYLDGNLVVKAL